MIKAIKQYVYTCLAYLLVSQTSVAQQTFPYSSGLLNNGKVLLASVSYQYFNTQKKLLLTEYSQQGVMLQKKEINIDTLSVEKTGGVYVLTDSTLVVFCTFAGKSNVKHPKYWGYVLLNKQYNTLKLQTYPLWFPANNFAPQNNYPFVADFLRLKPLANGGFYGMVSVYLNSNPHFPIQAYFSRYSTWVKLSNNLELEAQQTDTGYTSFGFYFSLVDELGGDLLETDSGYLGILARKSWSDRFYLVNLNRDSLTNKKTISDDRSFSLKEQETDTSQSITSYAPYLQLTPFKAQTHLVSLSGIFEQQRKVNGDWIKDDTANFNKWSRGFILTINDTGKVLNYAYTIPADSSYRFGSASPAVYKNLDYIDKNRIYYTENTDDMTPFYDRMDSYIVLALLDSNLNKKWVKYIEHPSNISHKRHLFAQTIQATPDGGCLIFANIAYEYNFIDTTIYQDSARLRLNPYWYTIVYKVMPDGQITAGVRNVEAITEKPLLYPNPTVGLVEVTNTSNFAQYALYNALGQLLQSNTITTPTLTLNLSSYQQGMYYLLLTDAKGNATSQKVLLQH